MLKRLFSGEESHRTSQPGVGMVSQKSKKSRSVRVSTMDAELEFQIDVKTSGKALFDLVCRTIGLRETWYFGLQYIDPKGYVCWMKPGKKVLAHNIPKDDVISLQFLAKFYPEDITLLVQQVTQHLFFLQVRQYILSMDIYCPPAPSVLLASYAMQAKYGDIVDELTPDIWAIEKLLPQRVIDQFEMTADMWVDKVKPYHADHQGMHRDDAELEYLKIVQELEMYGINYFSISNKKNSELWLGIDALGLKVYAKDNRLEPEIMFPWSEIKTILCRDRKFTIKLSTGKRPANDSLLSTTGRVRDFVFTAQKSQTSKLILELCIGNHELFKQRRVPDTMEVQQMKTQASEEKARREAERFRIAKEKQMREQLMKEKEEALQMIAKLKEEYQQSQNALLRSEETADLLAEKSQTTEEEATLLRKKALEAENEVQRIKMAAKKVEEENFKMDRRVQESEHLMAQIVDEYKLRTVEVAQLKDELQKKNEITEQLVKEKLMQNMYQSPLNLSPLSTDFIDYDRLTLEQPLEISQGHSGLVASDIDDVNVEMLPIGEGDAHEIADMALNLENHRAEYMEKSKHLHADLEELKNNIEVFQVDEKQTAEDVIHEEILRKGETKHTTLKKIKSGTTKARVQYFEEL